MLKSRRIISIILTIILAFCSGSVAFAEEGAAEDAQEETAVSEQAEPETQEAAEPDADSAMDNDNDAVAEDDGNKDNGITETESVEIVEAATPIEASKAAPAADNDAFYTVNLDNGKVADQNDNTVANGFAEIYGETYSATGLKDMSDPQREEQITEMTKEAELYSLEGTDGKTAEVVSIYSACRLMVDEKAAGGEVDTMGAKQAVAYKGHIILSYEDEEATASAYQRLCDQYGKENVLIDLPCRLTSTDQAENYWGTKYMGFRNVAPGIKTYGDYVTVAVLDSGINRSHTLINDGRTIYAGYDFANNDKNPADDNGHGTAVTSIITQSTEANVRILPVKIGTAKGDFTILTILYGLEYARAQGADVANMSFATNLIGQDGEFGDVASAKALVSKADTFFKEFSGPIVASAANDQADVDDNMIWPAVSRYTLTVSALQQGSNGPVFDSRYSNYGSAIDFAAPGSGINVADYRTATGTTQMSGTSCSAPFISAAAALIMANKSSISTKAQVKTALAAVCNDLGTVGKDNYYGFGCPVFTASNFVIDKAVRNMSKASVRTSVKVTYTGKALKPAVTVKYGRATLEKNKNYTVKYYNNKNVGKAKIVITGIGVRHTGKKTVTFRINPKGTKLTQYSSGNKSMTLYWKKQVKKMSKKRVTGYQIQLATDMKFTKNKKTVKVKGYKKKKKTVKKLKKNKRYYVRIRTYMKTKSGTYYSPWSKTVYGFSD